jgi:hypothetical protein
MAISKNIQTKIITQTRTKKDARILLEKAEELTTARMTDEELWGRLESEIPKKKTPKT